MLRDADIRSSLKSRLRQIDAAALVVDEWSVGSSTIADVATVNGCLSGFEIKSDVDSLRRLERQVVGYEAVFDFSTAVVAERHLRDIRKALPVRWGISVARHYGEEIEVEPLRRPKRNSRTDSRARVRLLRRAEIALILRRHGVPVDRRDLVIQLWAKVLERLSPREIGDEVLAALKRRPGWKLEPSPRRMLQSASQ